MGRAIRALLVAVFLLMSAQVTFAADIARAGVPQETKIVVVKQTLPVGDPTVFEFAASYDSDGFSLSDGQQNDSGELAPGQYSVSETAPGGWTLAGVVCDSSNGGTEAFDSIQLDAGETVTCTFTNRKKASITVVKEAFPADGTNFTFLTTIPGHSLLFLDDAAVDDNDGISDTFSVLVDPGSFTIVESVLAGWDLTDITCATSDPNTGVTVVNNVAFFSTSPGETVTCTFTNVNELAGRITLVKDAQPDDAQDFAFTTTIPGFASVTLDDDADDTLPNSRSIIVAPGTYGIGENPVSGWALIGAVCSDGSPLGGIVVDPGENVTCTFTNQRTSPTCNGLEATIVASAGQTSLNGTNGNDVIVATSGPVEIHAKKGNDTICTGVGADRIFGDDGNDWIDAGNGKNFVKGGDQNDTVTTGSGDDQVKAGSGTDTVNAGDGKNKVDGEAGNDSLTTGSGNDKVNGGSGTDTCSPGGGTNKVKHCEA